jgi:hypothetical protein
VAELADAPDSGSGGSNLVQVQILSLAPGKDDKFLLENLSSFPFPLTIFLDVDYLAFMSNDEIESEIESLYLNYCTFA